MMMRAVFLDRDGVINEDTSPDFSENLVVLPKVTDAIKKFNDLGLMVIVVTNQPSIAKGYVSEEIVIEMHENLQKKLEKKGARMDCFYYCPHHPETHHQDIPVDRMKYRIECDCRKPKPGMILQAAKDHRIEIRSSFLVGDHDRDINAGKAAGCTTIKVEKNGKRSFNESGDNKSDFSCRDLYEAALLIEKLVRR